VRLNSLCYLLFDGTNQSNSYPAGHVYVHQMLYDFTSQGTNIRSAQGVYAVLYVASLVFTCAVYLQAGVPNWIILLLPLSKRLHSIYVLRLFNDCWASVTMQAAIWALGRSRGEFLGIMLFA
jgi:alpha-1,3-mannosyltransferase